VIGVTSKDIGDFLTSRRAKLTPEQTGLTAGQLGQPAVHGHRCRKGVI
jgi:hypothetical protein